MAAGIGGRTVAEAKERLSYVEALQWRAYIEQRGTLHAGMRAEVHTAQLLVMIAAAAQMKKEDGGAYTLADFTPHIENPAEESGVDFEQALKALQRIGHGN